MLLLFSLTFVLCCSDGGMKVLAENDLSFYYDVRALVQEF